MAGAAEGMFYERINFLVVAFRDVVTPRSGQNTLHILFWLFFFLSIEKNSRPDSNRDDFMISQRRWSIAIIKADFEPSNEMSLLHNCPNPRFPSN